ncbi:Acyl-CoA dehydrogenase/oxidase [Penicillium cf. griseofulvum]|uniref:Acyl-CoA dehydrogenase/oxidase n=1 Tax=Penicillium cf. griseofulvum TaxID=2972120 RepID=A0A9W9M496_9EURO|nr:Acyl-CoA dehydrogenase/oxidase [Penicillium cf. griseofulvum]KAJ5434875.1 Acyl-CoA dehydrogenase/oxidase [Penicillium cf. griseofulvum]KAJ5452707.1 Acyl-CoA dehydrogenase/oxidase [Penicillium cf. griseofulvum]
MVAITEKACFEQPLQTKESAMSIAIADLAQSPLYKPAPRTLSLQECTRLTYQRAKAFRHAYGIVIIIYSTVISRSLIVAGLTIQDVLRITPKFFKMHTNHLAVLDGGAFTLLTIQCNLFVGTVAPLAINRPELQSIIESAMNFDVSAQFMLTEVNHGLDARNIQTTATILPDGDIDLHTPSANYAKVMPPTTPRGGIPVIAVVMARLIIEEKDCGIRPFLVQIGDGKEMCKGVIAKALPPRTGAHPVDHAITYFNHVRLPGSALLGSLEETKEGRESFLSTIHRVVVGTLALSGATIPSLEVATFNAYCFSRNRLVSGPDGKPMAVLRFRTQHLPILYAVAQYSVLRPFYLSATLAFQDRKIDPRVRHGIAIAFKAAALAHFSKSIKAMNERCGWHGHFENNQLLQFELEMRGVSTAEGDIRVLAIKLASELLIGRYQMPPPKDPNSPTSRHEISLLSEGKALFLKSAKGIHRSEQFNRDILPLALPLVEAIAYRMAIEAAQEANLDLKLIDMYEIGVIKEDSAWYAEQGGLSRETQREMESQAADALLPELENIMRVSGVKAYSNAPMTSKGLWDEFIAGLETFEGNAKPHLLYRA